MKFMDEVTSEKLRGAFYTPDLLVDACLAPVAERATPGSVVRILEPSAGDGAFVRGVARCVARRQINEAFLICVELDEAEASRCRQEMGGLGVHGTVVHDSFFHWADQEKCSLDAVVGNPPFLRYQFVPPSDRLLAEMLLRMRGHELEGVSNIWIPFVLLCVDALRIGGTFSMVLPSELLATISTGQVRKTLIRNLDDLRIELFPRDSFPDILQDVLIVSGVKSNCAREQRRVTFCQRSSQASEEWQHEISERDISWTRYLLSASEWAAFSYAQSLTGFASLGEVAVLGVANVTGANDFFTVDDETVGAYGLEPWTRPLLVRTAESPGIVFNQSDFRQVKASGKKAWLLDFSADRPDPLLMAAATRYIETGIAKGLPARYKCRIRSPWYRVPQVKPGTLMMPKRSHRHPRLLVNEASVATTDTIYRGAMKPEYQAHDRDLAAGFHNSVTLLSAELEGRTYGGGVLELVPSEVSRLRVPMLPLGDHLGRLDCVSRDAGGQRDASDTLVMETDDLLCGKLPGYRDALQAVAAARVRLRDRRFSG